MSSPKKFHCPGCGAQVFDRAFARCERCHAELPPELLYSEAEKAQMREAARHASATHDKIRKAINLFAIVGILAVWGYVVISQQSGWKEMSAIFAVGLGVAVFKLWAMSRDDGLNPSLRKNRPNKALEPTTTSVTSPAAQEPRQP